MADGNIGLVDKTRPLYMHGSMGRSGKAVLRAPELLDFFADEPLSQACQGLESAAKG